MRGRFRPAYALLAVFVLVIGWTERRLSAALPWRYPAVNELVYTDDYLSDVGALMVGSRRLAADLAYIQFLQYYGLTEKGHHGHGHSEEEDDHDHGEDSGKPLSPLERARREDFSGGQYPRLKEMSERILRIDPYFNTVILEAAGALAYNQKRVDEALALLKEAIERDPSFFRYHLYVSAILYKEKGNDAGLVGLLMEAIKYPDCPPMFEMILGNLLVRLGRPADAAQVYLHTSMTAAKDYERSEALRRLERVKAEHPNLPI